MTRPWWISSTWAAYISSGSSSPRNRSWAWSAVAFGGSRPIRFETRSTWRSTAMTGMPKQNASTIEAVFLPMPSIWVSQSRASSAGRSPRNARL